MQRRSWALAVLLAWVVATGFLAAPVIAASQTTPVATPVGDAGAGSLAALLALAPDTRADAYTIGTELGRYADLQTQFAAVGVERPAGIADDEASVRALGVFGSVAVPDPFRSMIEDEHWLPVVGFAPSQVDQVLQLGSSIHTLGLLRGTFDPVRIEAALLHTGFRETVLDGVPVWSLDLERERGLDSPTRALGLDNVGFLPDGTLVTASRLDGVRAVLDVLAGRAPSLADDPDVAALLAAAPPDLVGAILWPGGLLESADGEDPSDPAVELPPLPEVRLVLFGLTAGGPVRDFSVPVGDAADATPVAIPGNATARFVIFAAFADPAAAERAAPLIADRIATLAALPGEVMYRDWLGDARVEAVPRLPVVGIEAVGGALGPDNWQTLTFVGTVAFLSWSQDAA